MAATLWACGGDNNGSTTGPSSSGAGGTSSSSGGEPTSTGQGGGGVSAIPCEGAPADPALEGTWIASGKLALGFKGAPGGAINICPADQIGEAPLVLLLSVKADPADAAKLTEVHATFCSLELPTVSAVVGTCDPKSQSLLDTQIVAPDAFLAALPGIVAPPIKGAVTGKGSGATVQLDRLDLEIGATKGGAALPTWNEGQSASCTGPDVGHNNVCAMACVTDCSAVRDDDADTYPAVTLEICGRTSSEKKMGVVCHAKTPDDPGTTLQGRAFMDFQVDPQLKGTVKSSCEITGNIDTGIRYGVIGADLALAGSPLSVAQTVKALPTFSVDAAASKFRMVRIDGKYGSPSWGVDLANAKAACATALKRLNDL